jgi:Na+-transporting methylmalonyl-CoA/oxaloacetate decarboxylase gamma subunit
MENQGNRTPSVRLQMGGIAAVLLSLGALAAMIAGMPSVAAVSSAPTVASAVSTDEPKPRVRDRCDQCAVVTAVRDIEPLEHGIHSGAGRRTTTDVGNVMTGESARRYEVTLRMRDGSIRVIVQAGPANWRVNERLILIGGVYDNSES